MLLTWLYRVLIFVADSLLGGLLYLPLAIQLLSYRNDRSRSAGWDENNIPRLDGKVALVTGAR